MRIQRWFCGAIALSMTAVLAGSVSANIISNPGFEAGTGGDADDWNEIAGSSGSTTRSSSMPNSGGWSAYMEFDHVNNPAAGAAYFVDQATAAGTVDNSLNYDLSFSAKVDSTDFTGVDAFYQVLWLDADGSDGGGVKGETLTSLVGLGINTDYQSFSLNDIDVPDGADSVLLRFQISPGAVQNIVNGLYVDDVSLSQVVPEPASFALLGLFGMAAVARRRRG